jgi:hypothetical protein
MADDDRISPAGLDDSSGPVPVPPPGKVAPPPPPGQDESTGEPVPVPPPKKKVEDDDERIALVDDLEISSDAPSAHRVMGSGDGMQRMSEFKRAMNLDGQGATRCRIFTSKLAPDPILHLENMINEWLDEADIEVKNCTQTIGTVHGKRSEENLIMVIWY